MKSIEAGRPFRQPYNWHDCDCSMISNRIVVINLSLWHVVVKRTILPGRCACACALYLHFSASLPFHQLYMALFMFSQIYDYSFYSFNRIRCEAFFLYIKYMKGHHRKRFMLSYTWQQNIYGKYKLRYIDFCFVFNRENWLSWNEIIFWRKSLGQQFSIMVKFHIYVHCSHKWVCGIPFAVRIDSTTSHTHAHMMYWNLQCSNG